MLRRIYHVGVMMALAITVRGLCLDLNNYDNRTTCEASTSRDYLCVPQFALGQCSYFDGQHGFSKYECSNGGLQHQQFADPYCKYPIHTSSAALPCGDYSTTSPFDNSPIFIPLGDTNVTNIRDLIDAYGDSSGIKAFFDSWVDEPFPISYDCEKKTSTLPEQKAVLGETLVSRQVSTFSHTFDAHISDINRVHLFGGLSQMVAALTTDTISLHLIDVELAPAKTNPAHTVATTLCASTLNESSQAALMAISDFVSPVFLFFDGTILYTVEGSPVTFGNATHSPEKSGSSDNFSTGALAAIISGSVVVVGAALLVARRVSVTHHLGAPLL